MPPTEPSGRDDSATAAGPDDAKRALRERMRLERAALSLAEREERAALIEERLLALEELRAARAVLAFSSFGTEVPTERIVARLRASGHRVLLPYLDADRTMQAAETAAGEELLVSGYGPKEPARREPADPAGIDVVLVPGLAFDRGGRRLGYGRGNFDRFLPRLRRDALRAGLAFAFQVVEEVPAGPADQLVDAIVTDREVIRTVRR